MIKNLDTPERDLTLLNRERAHAQPENTVETLAQLRARITAAKTREPRPRTKDIDCLCRDCRAIWTRARDVILREIETGGDP